MSTPDHSACDFCGLPLPATSIAAGGPEYCCFGCRFAAEVSASHGAEGEARWTLARLGLAIFLSMNVMVFTMVLWSQDVYHDTGHPQFSQALADCFRYLGLIFSLPVMWVLGLPLADTAWQRTRAGQLSSDLLIVVGVTAAFLYSTVSVFRGSGAVYFEVACVVLVMVTLGRWLEATGRSRAHSALELLEKLLPETADRIVGLPEGTEERVPLDELRAGDRIRVRAGQRMPADGCIVGGCARLDEQILTGESQGTDVKPGDSVRAGCLNLDGDLLVELTSAPREGTWQRLIVAVDRARHIKGYYERLTDRLSRVFLPLVISLSLLTFALHTLKSGVEAGVMAGLAVVLISCPCALGLATPLAIWVAHGEALRRGVLFSSSEALERLAEVRAIACDKTGTLTTGVPRLEQTVVEHETDASEVHRVASGMCRASEHVLALGLREALSDDCDAMSELSFDLQVRTIPGRGLVAESIDSAPKAWLGSPRFLAEEGLVSGARVRLAMDSSAGQSTACLGWNGEVRAVFLFQETLREDARPFCEASRNAGLEIAVLTGDHAAGAGNVARLLELPVSAGLLPDEKVAAIEALRARFGPVAMIGDGINDAPALAASDVGIALGCGADIARSSADVCLMGNDLRRVPWAIELAHRTRRTIRQNLAWSLVYNVVGIGLAMVGWLNPVLAAIAMVLGSAFVVSNSLRWKHELAEQLEATEAGSTREPAGKRPIVSPSPIEPWESAA